MCERRSAPCQSAIKYYGEGYTQALSRLASDEDLVGANNRAAMREAALHADGKLGYAGDYRGRSLDARDPFFRMEH